MNKLISALALIVCVACLMSADGCQDKKVSTADQKQAKATNILLSEANRQVGMPNITNFTERKLAKMILELRDTEGLVTYTYIVDLYGKLHFLTESIGYGLPYSVQFTNPESVVHKETYQGGSFGTLPQADPNGLFMPGGLSATWIIAATESGPTPMYVEPSIIVSPFRLNTE